MAGLVRWWFGRAIGAGIGRVVERKQEQSGQESRQHEGLLNAAILASVEGRNSRKQKPRNQHFKNRERAGKHTGIDVNLLSLA
jgi:hypothetical protein